MCPACLRGTITAGPDEVRKKDLERQLLAADVDHNIEVHPNIAELYAKKVMELQSLLIDETTRSQAITIRGNYTF